MSGESIHQLVQIAYFLATIGFILGLKFLSSPKTAPTGNRLAGVAMLIVIIGTLFEEGVTNYGVIAAGMVVGGGIGLYGAIKVPMTGIPQFVALFNGAGGGASMIVALLDLMSAGGAQVETFHGIVIALGALVGAVTFSGSVIAFAKLQNVVVPQSAFRYPGQQVLNVVLALGVVATAVLTVISPTPVPYAFALSALSLLLGVAIVLPIGGADMPPVISLLNSYSGIAVTFAGFVLGEEVLIVSGLLVGASGIILTQLMCAAMNRSIWNVLFGAFGAATAAGPSGKRGEAAPVRSTTPEDAATLLAYARTVVIVPGYGMAVAQAQHAVKELADALEARGVDVKYAIHPVAGRMPGHMNVLLAEANVPYDQLVEMEEINRELPRTDVALIIGANDVVNPAAHTTPGSPIYGMPIIEVDKAANIFVIKRSMRPGFAGIDNDLFLDPKTALIFGDAKAVASKLTQEVKAA